MRTLPFAAALAALLPSALFAQAPTVDSVVVETHNVFGPEEAERNFLFRLANALHVRTRTWVVRRELLFRAGEPYDSAAVAETLRNLRARRLFRDVAIDTLRRNGRLLARVTTDDGWTTNLNLSARSTGGEFTWGTGVTERNLLGTGNLAGASYRHEADRNALRIRGQLNRLGGTGLFAEGFYDDLTDGTAGEWAVRKPFRALGDRLAVHLEGAAAGQRLLQFREGDVDSPVEFYRRGFLQRVDVMVAPVAGTRGYVRVGIGGQIRREEIFPIADTAVVIPDSVSGAVRAFGEWLRPRYKVVRHYNGFARDEDVDLSTRIRFGAWLAPSGLGYAESGVGPEVEVQTGVGFGEQFVRLEARAHGLFTGTGLDSGAVQGAVTVASLALPRQAVVLRIEGGLQDGPVPGSEFDLGHGVGPRAFRSHAFTGTRAIWGTLEHRWFAWDEIAGLFGLGFATFVDYGGAWFDGEAPRYGGDAGLGIRIGATRSTGANVGRIDLARTFGDGPEAGRWVVSFGRSLEF